MHKKLNSRGVGHHLLLPLVAILSVGAIGYYMVNLTKAETPSQSATFKLFSPAWRGMGDDSNIPNRKYFTEVFTNMTPKNIKGLAKNAKVYNYTLGPYVTQAYVRCGLIPDTNKDKDLKKCGRPGKVLPDSAISVQKDNHHQATYARAFTNNFLLVPDDTATLRYVKSLAAQELRAGGKGVDVYDGILSDSMGVAPLGSGYLISPPWNPGTNPSQTYGAGEWLAAQNKMLSAKKEGIGDKELIINGLANGRAYFQSPSAGKVFGDNPKVTGLMAERIFREPQDPMNSRPDKTEWKKDVDMIADVQAKGKKGYWWTKCWTKTGSTGRQTCHDEPDYRSGIKKLLRFTMSSYLLGAGDKSYYNFDTDICDGGPVNNKCPASNAAEWFDDYLDAKKLGKAKGAYTALAGGDVFVRKFENGIVVVNPDKSAHTVTLDSGTYKDLDGNRAPAKPSVPAGSGMIYLKG